MINFVVFVAYSSGWHSPCTRQISFAGDATAALPGTFLGDDSCSASRPAVSAVVTAQCGHWPVTVPPTIICHAVCVAARAAVVRAPAAVDLGYAHPPRTGDAASVAADVEWRENYRPGWTTHHTTD